MAIVHDVVPHGCEQKASYVGALWRGAKLVEHPGLPKPWVVVLPAGAWPEPSETPVGAYDAALAVLLGRPE